MQEDITFLINLFERKNSKLFFSIFLNKLFNFFIFFSITSILFSLLLSKYEIIFMSLEVRTVILCLSHCIPIYFIVLPFCIGVGTSFLTRNRMRALFKSACKLTFVQTNVRVSAVDLLYFFRKL